MARSVLSTPMGQMMYSDALLRMAGGGQLLPHEQDILTLAPLPESFISPFASQESGLLETLRTTAKALDVWDEEIKKVDYFTKHFTDLSKMVMKGVTTMGRGLMSLHNMGADLSLSPKSIQDLIMIASYHFRKSYIGVLQTVKKYPEVSTRLLVNQLDWANMIFRLNVTKAKLAKPMAKPSVVSGAASSQLPAACGVDSCKLPVAGDVISGQLPMADEVISCRQPAVSELSELKPMSEPSAIGGSRAFYPLFSGSKSTASSSQRPATSGVDSCQLPVISKVDEKDTDIAEEKENNKSAENRKTEMKEKDPAEANEKENDSDKVKNNSETQTESADENEINPPEEEISEKENETDGVRPSCLNPETRGSDPTVSPPDELDPIEQAFTNKGPQPPKPGQPSYAGIVMGAIERNKGNPEGIRFTMGEVCQLLANPDFCRDEPEIAAQFRTFLLRAGP